ncbi:PREDICTED: serine palmitoyltransferase small subunit A-A [Ceratosolen solmsi marchali]|uniref:Serine palmitoyltransferase small subunit A-A n=1 Tax=Ceratosolen solmsi marchali TaxID=326594 RepID=A0AAJ6YRN8_9HYME|nr:PREDICTED: serine palmitoyltransferase small subunit A-A [Ceratosolen solmsi marchali]
MKLLEKVLSFLQYWYFRYTLVTELYMVEKWERHFINIFLVSLFCLLFYFNHKILLPATSLVLSAG